MAVSGKTKKELLEENNALRSRLKELERSEAEYKTTQEELKKSKEFLDNIVNALDDSFFIKDQEHRWVMLNDAACELMGRSREELIGKSDYDIFPKEQADVLWEKDNHVFEAGKTNVNEEQITWRDQIHTISTKKSLYTDPVTGKKFITGISRNITDQKKAEVQIKEQNDFLNLIIESLKHPFYIIDANDYTIKMLNSAACSTPLPEGQTCYNLTHNQQRPCFGSGHKCTLEEIKKTNEPVIVQHNHLDENGDPRYIEVYAYPVFDKQGDLIQVIEYCFDITERKQLEEAYRCLVDNSLQGLEIIQDGRIVFINKAMASMTGYSEDEILDATSEQIRSFVHPEDRELVWTRNRDRLAGKYVPERYEFRGIRKDGSIYWLEIHASRIEYQGRPAIQAAFVDLTEQKRLQEAYYNLVDNSLQGLTIVQDGRMVFFNKAFRSITGYNEEELSAASPEQIQSLVHPEDRELVWTRYRDRLAGKPVPSRYEYRLMRKDGSIAWVEVHASRIEYQGRPAIQSTYIDITERKKAEQALRQSEQRLKILFESAPDAIYLNDMEGNFVDGNKAAEKMVGYAKEELVGKSFAEAGLLCSEHLLRAFANLEKNAMGEPAGPDEFTLIKKDGSTVAVEIRTFPVKIGEQLLSLGIARDISARKKDEKKLFEYRAQLKSLASELSLAEERERHRLATDLHDHISQALVFSRIKLQELHASVSSAEIAGPLGDACDNLDRIIQDTRTLTFDLSSPILYELGFEAAVSEWLEEQIGQKHDIKTQFENDGLPKPLEDDIRILLFRNVRELLVNVFKHAEAQNVKVSISRISEEICVSVEDDGIGFNQAEVASKAGFGIFSIRERLEQLAGHIKIESEPGQGTKITMTAPLKCDEISRENKLKS